MQNVPGSKRETKEYRKKRQERKRCLSAVATKKNHNTGGVKFQQALVAHNHIPAKGMCGQGV